MPSPPGPGGRVSRCSPLRGGRGAAPQFGDGRNQLQYQAGGRQNDDRLPPRHGVRPRLLRTPLESCRRRSPPGRHHGARYQPTRSARSAGQPSGGQVGRATTSQIGQPQLSFDDLRFQSLQVADAGIGQRRCLAPRTHCSTPCRHDFVRIPALGSDGLDTRASTRPAVAGRSGRYPERTGSEGRELG